MRQANENETKLEKALFKFIRNPLPPENQNIIKLETDTKENSSDTKLNIPKGVHKRKNEANKKDSKTTE